MFQDLKDNKNVDPRLAGGNLLRIGSTCFDDLPADG